MEKVKVGVLGLGSIFKRVMADFPNAQNCELYALAARDLARAEDAKAKYGAARAFGSYEELLDCPEVELVYVATPHSLHFEQVKACLAHGKHVICEKAFCLNDAQAAAMAAMAREKGLFLMEAMWTRFLPAIVKLRELAREGALGEIRHVTADFSYAARFDPESRVYAPRLAGGALLDVGIYPLSMIAMLLGDAPASVDGICVMAPSGVDARTVAQLRYQSGATAQLMCGVDVNGDSKMTVFGTEARVDIPDFWHATRLEIARGRDTEILAFPPETEGHHHQFVHAADLIRRGLTESPVMPLTETVNLMKLMTDIRRANGFLYPGES
jgi:predicted dehydrogenase